MGNAQAIAFVMAPAFLVVGLSVLLYAKQWQKLYGKWIDDHFSLFTLMAMQLVLGLIVIYNYNVWEWNVWLLVTLSGWAMFVKGALYFLAPGSFIKMAFSLGKNTTLLYLGGVIALLLGGFLGYYTFLV